jgi:integrase
MAGALNARKVEALKEPGRYSDGGNLFLHISPNGGKRWIFAYRGAPKPGSKNNRYEMGLGSAGRSGVSLADARNLAAQARQLLRQGIDPLSAKRNAGKAERTIPIFGTFADEYIRSHAPKFRNAKHLAQWEMTLGDEYCRAIRSKPVNQIDTEAILAVLQPIWTKVPETAARLRGRIENVLDAAKARGFRDGPNPATWRGHLKTLLPVRQRLTRGHHSALAYDNLPAFMVALRARQSLAALALEMCILTATRTSEVLNAEWSEFDLEKKVWTIPAVRMKAGHAHRIPLTDRALDILKGLPKLDHNPHVFPGHAKGKPLSGMAMTMQLRRMKREDITVHGFRSTFRDWASEQTSFPHETCEHALAHRISDKAEAAYRRGDQFEKRRNLMDAWAAWCEPVAKDKVVRLRPAGA